MLTSSDADDLALAMTHRSPPPQFIDAGYTYLGQFIAHELVHETNPAPGRARSVTASMDLDSVYGSVPGAEPVFDDAGRFRFGKHIGGRPVDLFRLNGVALIPEHRNDDNVIVAQLHVLWQRLHNFTIDECGASPAEARRLVTLVFQLIVVEDYLAQVLTPSVFDSYFRRQETWLGFAPDSIPLEFSHAVFRFGHSMVRASYEGFSGPPEDRDVDQLFRPNCVLPPNLVIDWRRFFGKRGVGNLAQDATRIDPFITPAMRSARAIAVGAPAVDIVKRNLRAGEVAHLKPGHTYVLALLQSSNGSKLKARFELQPVSDIWQDLRARLPATTNVRIDNLPLWPYVLNEAFLATEGRHLGPLGGLMCAEVLANSIMQAGHSIYREGWLTGNLRLGELGNRIRSLPSFEGSAGDLRALRMRHILDLLKL
jgi:hypothetical protein